MAMIFQYLLNFFFPLGQATCGIQIPNQGQNSDPLQAEAQSPNGWTTVEVPHYLLTDEQSGDACWAWR